MIYQLVHVIADIGPSMYVYMCMCMHSVHAYAMLNVYSHTYMYMFTDCFFHTVHVYRASFRGWGFLPQNSQEYEETTRRKSIY